VSLLSEISSPWDYDFCDADLSWWLQSQTARAARALGFDGVEVSDEQGTSIMIDMLGKTSVAVGTL
jgi:hypothetical protein